MKQFTTSAKAKDDQVAEPVELEVDGRKLTFAGPDSKTLLILMSIYAEMDSGDQILALGSQINLVFNLLGTEDRNYIRRRMFDPKDDFGGQDFVDIFRYLIGEWSGRPTEQPSDSDSPPSDTGVGSTGMQRLVDSIPDGFGQTGS